jgi:hypothetical protein
VASNVEPLPADVIALHIGPHKTGTTTLQGAFHNSRTELAKHSVHYAGPRRHPMLAVLSVTGKPGRKGDPKPTRDRWDDLVAEVHSAAGRRVVLSSEFLTDATPEVANEVVDQLGRDRVHVIVTLRPLAKIMPSQWQQYVQNGLRVRYPDWLDHMLNLPPYEAPTPSFWKRHRHSELVQRWATVVGPDRLTVVVLDDTDRRMLLSTFEGLLDVPIGTLVPDPALSNRSLTQGEVEVIRRLNEEFVRRHWPDWLYGKVAREGVAKKMLKRPTTAEEAAIVTPQWALEQAAQIGAETASAIKATGVNIIGDLDSLGVVPAATAASNADQPLDAPVPASAATIAIVGTVLASRGIEWPLKGKENAARSVAAMNEATLDSFSTADLLRTAIARGKRRAGIKMRTHIHR